MRKSTESEHNVIEKNISKMLKGESIRNYFGLILAVFLTGLLYYLSIFGNVNNGVNSNNSILTYVFIAVFFGILLLVFALNLVKINRYKKIILNKTYDVLDCVSENIEVKYPDFIDNRTRICATIKDKEKKSIVDGSYEILNEIGSSNYYSFSNEFKKADCILVNIEDNMKFVLYNKI